jgi:cytosolic carboxypeptidase protein 5
MMYQHLRAKASKIPKAIKSNKPKTFKKKTVEGIYFHHDVLIHSNDGHKLDILTISSKEGITDDVEDKIDGLFVPGAASRSRKFKMANVDSTEQTLGGTPTKNGKQFFFLSARVHPAETISSYILDGFIDFIISSDPRAIKLRNMFVFKIIPMLNPDGVVRGHYRGDARGTSR